MEQWSLHVLSSPETGVASVGVCVFVGEASNKGSGRWWHFANCVVLINNGKILFVEIISNSSSCLTHRLSHFARHLRR